VGAALGGSSGTLLALVITVEPSRRAAVPRTWVAPDAGDHSHRQAVGLNRPMCPSRFSITRHQVPGEH
jgi:hypothetical protein